MTERLENRDNVYGRFAVYLQGLRIFREAPLVGVGVGRFMEVQAATTSIEVAGVRQVDTPHSSIVSALAEQGVWGTLPLLYGASNSPLALLIGVAAARLDELEASPEPRGARA